MDKICFPHHIRGDFKTLKSAYNELSKKQYGWSEYHLINIVRYNIKYRDYLRNYGIESLIQYLLNEAPALENEVESIQMLKDWYNDESNSIADYDIQCYNIKDGVNIMGHIFNGLEDIKSHRKVFGRLGNYGVNRWVSEDKRVDEYCDIYVGEWYEPYPIFDSYDIGDDRTYQNYIFRSTPLTEDDMYRVTNITHRSNYCMVHENIPDALLPILYYSGDDEHMLLASAKRK